MGPYTCIMADREDVVPGGRSRIRPWRPIARASVVLYPASRHPRQLISAVLASRAAPGSGGALRTQQQHRRAAADRRRGSGGARGAEQHRRRAELRVAREQRIAKYKV